MSTDEKQGPSFDREINVELHEPNPVNPRYTAFVEEFAMTAEGDTLDDAISALFAKVLAYGEPFLKAGQPLPPRTPGVSTGDERAGQMSGR